MPDIESQVVYSQNSVDSITKIRQIPEFNHTLWGHPDLESFRSEVREFYRIKQNGSCAFCRKPVSLTAAANCQVEHIVPKSKHPKFIFTEKNLCVICADCNLSKGQKETLKKPSSIKLYPRSSGAFLIVHPHFDTFEEHITIKNEHYYVDITEKGHYTIGACKLNRRLRKFGVDESITEDNVITELTKELLNCKDTSKRRKIIAEIGYLESLKS